MKSSHNIILMATLLVIAMQPVSQAILTSAGNQMWHLESSGVAGVRQNYDYFGSSLSAGDFNGDGCEDLAIGIPDNGLMSDGGRVSVLYGSTNRITPTDSQIWSQNSDDIPGTSEWNDDFGYAVAAGDFNGDGFDDLAIGAPGESGGDVEFSSLEGAEGGMVHILYGSTNRLSAISNQYYFNNLGWRTGSALASGDINADGCDDLVIGAPGRDTVLGDVGYAVIAYGTTNGFPDITATNVQYYFPQWITNTNWYDPTDNWYEASDLTGYALACGDLDGNGCDDVVIGSPGATVESKLRAGEVHVAYGSTNGLPVELVSIDVMNQRYDAFLTHIPDMTNMPNVIVETWSQEGDIAGSPELDDRFGSAVAIADFDNDGCVDLAVGVPLENISGKWNAGMINVIYGTTNGLASDRNKAWHQNSGDVNGTCEGQDNFGSSLATGDFNHDGCADLAIGVPEENIDSGDWWEVIDRVDCGMVNVLYGSTNGLTDANDQSWHQDSGSIAGGIEHNDYFGWALAAGDFDGNGSDDLAIGVPGEDTDNHPAHWDEGAVNVIYSSPGNRAPIADAGEDTNVVCEAGTTVMVVLDGSGSYDPDGHEITYAWEWVEGSATGDLAEVELPLGTNVITLVVSDEQEDSEPDTVIITVMDIAPPVFNSIAAAPAMLWPPNHKMMHVEVGITATDNCDPSPDITLDAVTMNEGESDDCVILDTYNTMLRSECSGHMPERVYTLHYSATDDWGNTESTSIDVVVPHDRGKRNNKK